MNDQHSSWFASVPSSELYPWQRTTPVPNELTHTEVAKICSALKEEGNISYIKTDYFNALKKYENYILFSRAYQLGDLLPYVLCNAALCCLRLGEARKKELIEYQDERCWYIFACNYAQLTLECNPNAELAVKAHRRRGKALKILNDCSIECQEHWRKMFPFYPSSPKKLIVFDFSECFNLGSTNISEYLFNAIIEAVKHDEYTNLPTLTEKHAKIGVGTELLKQLVISTEANWKHIECLILKLKRKIYNHPYFDASSLSPEMLSRKGVCSNEILYTKLKEYGLPTSTGVIKNTQTMIPDEDGFDEQVFKSDSDQNHTDKLHQKHHKNIALKEWQILQVNAFTLYSSQLYKKALDTFKLAIIKCDNDSDIAQLHDSCATCCLKKEKYDEALIHSNECIKICPQYSKGYYRRAMVLEIILKTSPDCGTINDVIKDYIKCHSLQENVEAFGKAVIVAVKYNCTRLIPKLSSIQFRSGYCDQVLQYIKNNVQLTEAMVEFIFLKLPSNLVRQPYSSKLISLKEILTVTCNPKIIHQILTWRINIKSEDIIAAGEYIPDSSSDLLISILRYAARRKVEILNVSVLKIACWKAMMEKKAKIVSIFIQYGAEPHLEKLVQVPGVFIDLYLREYYFDQLGDMIKRKDTTHMMVHVKALDSQAKKCFENNSLDQAILYYYKALEICQTFNYKMGKASLHNNLAELYLSEDQYKHAYAHADTSIATLKNGQAYFWRAEALRNCLREKILISNKNVLDVLNDYKTSYQLEKNLKVLQVGVPFAVECDQAAFFQSECSNLEEDSCAMLIQAVLKHKHKKSALPYLASIWETKKIDCSSLSLRYIIIDERIFDQRTLSWLIACGLSISNDDFEIIIKYLPNNNSDTFSMLIGQFESLDKTYACQECFKLKKFSFVAKLLQQGAPRPTDCQSLLKELITAKKFGDTKEMISNYFTKEDLQTVNLGCLLETVLVKKSELISMLIHAGVNPNGKKSPIATVMKSELLGNEQKMELICLLIKLGADYKQLTLASQYATTPLHVATEWAVNNGGNSNIIDVLLPMLASNKNSKEVNERGDTPLHIAVKSHVRRKDSEKVLLSLLRNNLVDPSRRDKQNKRPIDHLTLKKDPRRQLILEYTTKSEPPKNNGKHKPNGQQEASKTDSKPDSMRNMNPSIKPSEEGKISDSSESSNSISNIIKKKEQSYGSFSNTRKLSYHIENIRKMSSSLFISTASNDPELDTLPQFKQEDYSETFQSKSALTEKLEDDSSASQVSLTSSSAENCLNLDDLPRKVECTKDVKNFFKDKKRFSRADRISAIKTIQQIAEGRKISKKVSNHTYAHICIWEARATHSARILWEQAISYCLDLSDEQHKDCPVIRIWDVVVDHDKLNERIKSIEQRALAEYEKGHNSAKDLSSSDSNFVPFDNKGKNTFTTPTFYSFDSSTVKSLIDGINDKREYPFKVSHEEHKIIKLISHEAILLLGRSGTGKTTCCLYRLWNECKNFWDPNSLTFGMKFSCNSLKKSSVCSLNRATAFVTESSKAENSEECIKDVNASNLDNEEINLHQAFISKNPILCDKMKKQFYKLAAAYDYFEPHMTNENAPIPNSFQKFHDMSFPAFLTARQYYIILDNSLDDDKQFFKRNGNGDLLCEIVSWDYNMQALDISLEDEHNSEDEDDGIYLLENASRIRSKVKWTEVTALYFRDVIWPKISKFSKVSLDPLLVWLEIKSFIKGSELAVRLGAPLSFKDYKKIGNKMAPNYSAHRDSIFELYKHYEKYLQNQRYKSYLFDECDLVLNLHKRIKEGTSWSIHTIYIDEVQDFTQAELLLFIRTCTLPNYMFFTGDSAQSIMRGIAFRFEDLRSCFHQLHQSNSHIKVPEKPFTLLLNYRSHSGIVKLAASVIDLITEYFRDSIDCLPKEYGLYSGPHPVFLNITSVEELTLLLTANEQDNLTADFGAHQVILVQSNEARNSLPKILSEANCLTIFEAKGLEFDDVLLYNFFTNSMVDEKVWNVVFSYLENPLHHGQVKQKGCPLDITARSRFNNFDIEQHKSLNAELKYLYTAVTRAKGSLWIYDSDDKVRCPMMIYWHKRDLVEVVSTLMELKEVTEKFSTDTHTTGFTVSSSLEDWKLQGDTFMSNGLWQRAGFCYKKAGPEYLNLVKEAEAFQLIQDARQNISLYLEASICFLESFNLKHSNVCIRRAAICLCHCNPTKYAQAAELFEKIGCLEDAARCYLKANDMTNFIIQQERCQNYDSVVYHLLKRRHRREALLKAVEYETKGYCLSFEYSSNELSTVCAKFYLKKKKDNNTLKEVLQYMPEQEKRLQYLKDAKLYEEVYKHYVSSLQFEKAFELALAQNYLNKAITLAVEIKDSTQQAQFTLLMARSFCAGEDNYHSDYITELLTKLLKSSKNLLWKAEAHLLLGKIHKQLENIEEAIRLYEELNHKAGILESFKVKLLLKDSISVRHFLNCYHLAENISKAIKGKNDINVDVQNTMTFYGLKLRGKVYLGTKYSHCFIKFERLQKYMCEKEHDQIGMTRFNLDLKKAFVAYFDQLLDYTKFTQKVLEAWKSSYMYSILFPKKTLSQPLNRSQLTTSAISEYLQSCVNVLDLDLLNKKSFNEEIMAHLNHIFSPDVYMFVSGLSREHIQAIRDVAPLLNPLKSMLSRDLQKIGSNGKLKADFWLHIWRTYCLTYPNSTEAYNKLLKLEDTVNKTKSPSPIGYIYWRNDNKFYHLLRLWLNSCDDIRNNSRPNVLWASRLAINHFAGNIIEDRDISMTVLNLVNIFTIHTTALLVMMTQSNRIREKTNNFRFPQVYTHVVEVFDSMNCHNEAHRGLFSACNKSVLFCHYNDFLRTCHGLLKSMLEYLLGMHRKAPHYSMLKFSLEKLSEKDFIQCLILTLTLLGNLSLIQNTIDYKRRTTEIMEQFASNNPELPPHVNQVLKVFKNVYTISVQDIFELTSQCLELSNQDGALLYLSYQSEANTPYYTKMTVMPFKSKKLTSPDSKDKNQPSTNIHGQKTFPSVTPQEFHPPAIPQSTSNIEMKDSSSEEHYDEEAEEAAENIIVPQLPSVDIEAKFASADIVDEVNLFCNVCGIQYRDDGVDQTVEEYSEIDSYTNHFSGQNHQENTESYILFNEMKLIGDQCRNDSEQKIEECEAVNESIESPKLYECCDNLKREIESYDRTISQINDKRTWAEGTQKVEQINTKLQHILEDTNTRLSKVITKKDELKRKVLLKAQEKKDIMKEMEMAELEDDFQNFEERIAPWSKKKRKQVNKRRT